MRLALIIPLLAGLGWAAATAATLARADGAMLEASREMGSWAAARMQPARGTWDSVQEKLDEAQARAPTDPAVQELLGILKSSRADSVEALTESSNHFESALRARPTSPYTWANLAEVDYRQGNTGSRFLFAMQRAAELGPYEPEVQRMVADYGLAVWDEVDIVSRTKIDAMVRAGLRRNPLEMLQISERRGRLTVACRHLVGLERAPDPKWFQLCPSTEATP